MKLTCPTVGIVTLLLSAVTTPTRASTYTWIGSGGLGGAGSWNSNGHWSPTGPVTSADDTQFNAGAGTVNLGTGLRSAASITFGSSSGAYSFNVSSTPASGMSIGAGGIANNSSAAQVFNDSNKAYNIAVAANQAWQATSGNLTFNTTVGLGSFTLTLNPSVNKSVTIAGAIGGTGGISKIGSGTLNLNAANSYSGSTALSAGTLSFGVGQSMSGALNLSGGTLNPNNQTVSFGSLSLAGPSVISFGTEGVSQNLTFGSGAYTSGTLTIQNWSPSATSDRLFITAQPSPTFLNNVVFDGFGTGASWMPSGEIVPVPEPETYTLVTGLGLLGAAVLRRRMRRN